MKENFIHFIKPIFEKPMYNFKSSGGILMINPQYKNRARLSILIKSLDRGSQKPTNQYPINQA